MLNRKTFFVSFFLRRDRVMKNGTAPIMARISVNGIAKEIYTQCRTAVDRKSTRLNSSHKVQSRMPSSA